MAHNIPDTTVPVSEAYGIKEILEKYLGENSSFSCLSRFSGSFEHKDVSIHVVSFVLPPLRF